MSRAIPIHGPPAFPLLVAALALAALVAVTAAGAAGPPLRADAGPDQTVRSGDRVTLDGSGGDADQGTAFRWSQMAGPPVALEGQQTKVATFASPSWSGPGTLNLTFRFILRDPWGGQTHDDAVVSILPANTRPVADPGPDLEAWAGANVTLDGSASFDPEGAALAFNWTLEGSALALGGANTSRAWFEAPAVGSGQVTDLTFRLVVSDGDVESLPAFVRVRVVPFEARPPDHIAYQARGADGHTVDFTAPRRLAAVSYQWSFGDGGRSQAADPTHVYAADGTYTVRLQLVATDGRVATYERTIDVGPLPPEPEPSQRPVPHSEPEERNWPLIGGIAAAGALVLAVAGVLWWRATHRKPPRITGSGP